MSIKIVAVLRSASTKGSEERAKSVAVLHFVITEGGGATVKSVAGTKSASMGG
jgi:hypothetical protein